MAAAPGWPGGDLHGGHPVWRALDRGGVVHHALCVATLCLPRSGFAVALALVLLMLPVIERTTEEMLRIVPIELREASYALGGAEVENRCQSGDYDGELGHHHCHHAGGGPGARVMGETAPLLILVGYSQAMNFDLLRGFMGTLPSMMVNQTAAGSGVNPVPTERLWGAGLTLILLIAVINIGARVVSMMFAPKVLRRSAAWPSAWT